MRRSRTERPVVVWMDSNSSSSPILASMPCGFDYFALRPLDLLVALLASRVCVVYSCDASVSVMCVYVCVHIIYLCVVMSCPDKRAFELCRSVCVCLCRGFIFAISRHTSATANEGATQRRPDGRTRRRHRRTIVIDLVQIVAACSSASRRCHSNTTTRMRHCADIAACVRV